MDLSQTKLSKSEWNSVEIPVSDAEKSVLRLIVAGYANPDIQLNDTESMLSHIKISPSDEMHAFLFQTHFLPAITSCFESSTSSKKKRIEPTITKYVRATQEWLAVQSGKMGKFKSPGKADMIRIQNMNTTIQTNRYAIFEFVLLDFAMHVMSPGDTTKHPPGYYIYSLIQFKKSLVSHLNPFVSQFVDTIIAAFSPDSSESIRHVFSSASAFIEKNPHLIKYENRELYPHQKQLFRIFANKSKRHIPKLVMYMAPTGTGKTLSPIGLSESYRVIFVCVARHVGMALAKSAISVEKRVAFAFGCETASDIRLHYFAAVDYKINKRSGGIGKVDNSAGQKVEIMICDVASYLIAMRYMLCFNDAPRIITYWDEPTITMDYETHELHETIHKNWQYNCIPNMVLSCATLPKEWEIEATVDDFKTKFAGEDEETGEPVLPEIYTIDSYDCKKSITLLDKSGFPALPHLLFREYADLIRCVDHCKANKTLLRYLDVDEIVRFVNIVESSATAMHDSDLCVATYFKHVSDITMTTVKHYYLRLLLQLNPDEWSGIHDSIKRTLVPKLGLFSDSAKPGEMRKIKSQDVPSPTAAADTALRRVASVAYPPAQQVEYTAGVLITTKDAHTLTDGPTIFLSEDVDKIGTFYIQQSGIPDQTFKTIMEKIARNSQFQRKIAVLEKELQDKEAAAVGSGGTTEKTKKLERGAESNKEMVQLLDQLDKLRREIQSVSLPAKYIPNSLQHQDTWIPVGYAKPKNAFMPNIDESDVREIMGLDVSDQHKLLLIMGIGVFSQRQNITVEPATQTHLQAQSNTQYMEIMKRLAQEKRLFLIIASSDYVYGTNYQFSHGFVGKDLENMTQQKTIQAIGRVGRNNIQQDYTVRFRDDEVLLKLFKPVEYNQEAIIMSQLFVSV